MPIPKGGWLQSSWRLLLGRWKINSGAVSLLSRNTQNQSHPDTLRSGDFQGKICHTFFMTTTMKYWWTVNVMYIELNSRRCSPLFCFLGCHIFQHQNSVPSHDCHISFFRLRFTGVAVWTWKRGDFKWTTKTTTDTNLYKYPTKTLGVSHQIPIENSPDFWTPTEMRAKIQGETHRSRPWCWVIREVSQANM